MLGDVAHLLAPLLAGLALLLSLVAVWSSLGGPAFDGVLLAASGGMLSLAGGLNWQGLGRIAPEGHWRGKRTSQAAGEIVANLGLYSLAAMAILLLSYLCASTALPMQDAAMARRRWARASGSVPARRDGRRTWPPCAPATAASTSPR